MIKQISVSDYVRIAEKVSIRAFCYTVFPMPLCVTMFMHDETDSLKR